MQLETLSCNHCGAPFEVSRNVNYIKCNQCGAQLAIHRERSVSYTEKIGQLDQGAETISQQMAELRNQLELDAVDREWERERERYLISGRYGRSEPTATYAAMIGLTAGGCGVCFLIAAAYVLDFTYLLAGLAMVVGGIYGAASVLRRVRRFERARQAYLARRSELSETSLEGFGDRGDPSPNQFRLL